MTFDRSLRTRVERLLKGTYSADDFSELLLHFRQQRHAGEAVKEVGNFAAHRALRGKAFNGVVSALLRDRFEVLRFTMPYYASMSIDISNMSKSPEGALEATMRIVVEPLVRRRCHFRRGETRDIFKSLIKRITPNVDGTFFIDRPWTPKERTLFLCLVNDFTIRPAITADSLFSDFRNVLLRHGLLNQSDFSAFEKVREPLILYAITKMHHSTIILRDDTSVSLSVQILLGEISLGAEGYAGPIGTGNLNIRFPVVSTGLFAKDWCDGDLANPTQEDLRVSDALELRLNGKIGLIAG